MLCRTTVQETWIRLITLYDRANLDKHCSSCIHLPFRSASLVVSLKICSVLISVSKVTLSRVHVRFKPSQDHATGKQDFLCFECAQATFWQYVSAENTQSNKRVLWTYLRKNNKNYRYLQILPRSCCKLLLWLQFFHINSHRHPQTFRESADTSLPYLLHVLR